MKWVGRDAKTRTPVPVLRPNVDGSKAAAPLDLQSLPKSWRELVKAVLSNGAADFISIRETTPKPYLEVDGRTRDRGHEVVLFVRPPDAALPISIKNQHGVLTNERMVALQSALRSVGVERQSGGSLRDRVDHPGRERMSTLCFTSETLHKVGRSRSGSLDDEAVVTTESVSGPPIAREGEQAPRGWQAPKANRRVDYTAAIVTLRHGKKTLYIRAGEKPRTYAAVIKALTSVQAGLRSPARPLDVARVLSNTQHVLSGSTASVLRSVKHGRAGALANTEVTVESRTVAQLAQRLAAVGARAATEPPGSTKTYDQREIDEHLRTLAEGGKFSVATRSSGTIDVVVLDHESFERLQSQSTVHRVAGTDVILGPDPLARQQAPTITPSAALGRGTAVSRTPDLDLSLGRELTLPFFS